MQRVQYGNKAVHITLPGTVLDWSGRSFLCAAIVFNPRRTCAARVTVVGSVCGSVCLFVKSHLTYGAFVRPENAVTYSVGNEGQKICGDLPEMTAFESYVVKHERKSQYVRLSDVSFLRLTHSEGPEGTQRLSTTFSLAQNYVY